MFGQILPMRRVLEELLILGALKVEFTKRVAAFTPLATKPKHLTVLSRKSVLFLNLIWLVYHVDGW
jgi:hypothetical protein